MLTEALPKHVVGHGGHGTDFLSADGMDEADAAGVEADAAVGIAALHPVFQVALDGAANLGKLAANLMVTPRLETHLNERVAVAAANDTIVEFGPLAAWHLMVVGV